MEQHLELDTLGILRQVKLPASLAWMNEADKGLLLQLHLAGETGLHKRNVAKFEKVNPEVTLRVTVRDLAQWLSDKAGRPIYLALTWRGEEIGRLLLQVAKNESRKATRQ